ncbi:N-acetylmannosamine-6-phosphate 2-epimerase [Hydrogenoanaerobacterium sp.]|uniref:N-acetylmannosamine-6-phosphate 2-epimerase n=1 Tax=Hydrogenoanaerobacterium sp. TaxID=2953763 RepID=UPI0028A2389B|nr:N-acetylmannosamine-6-phosphate 2-epimerase [Hydrogenoanaerobacterium sp.]
MNNKEVLEKLRGGLIVSCQALAHEPMHSSYIMSRMAYAALLGGAVGIRANSVEDITEIKKTVQLPIIGIIKKDFESCNIYITPTMEEVDCLVETGVEIIAMDATSRPRPNGENIAEFFAQVRKKYPSQLFMADCATFEEAQHADEIGFDVLSTTLCGYTEDTKGAIIPSFELIQKLVQSTEKFVIAEGGIWTPEQLVQAYECGVDSAVVGTAITRPMDITRRFTAAIRHKK